MKIVFAYGSNLNPLQMIRRCPSAEFFGRAELVGFRLAFAGWSHRWRGAVATLERAPRGRTHGVLYQVHDSDLVTLDAYEGHPNFYGRELCAAHTERGNVLVSQTYVLLRASETIGVPATEYIGSIRRGYRAWGLPAQALAAAEKRACVRLDYL